MFANKTSIEIIWSKMGTPISRGNPKYRINYVRYPGIYKTFSTELCIRSLNFGDAGMYSCEIKYSSKLVSAQAKGRLQVMGKCIICTFFFLGLLLTYTFVVYSGDFA